MERAHNDSLGGAATVMPAALHAAHEGFVNLDVGADAADLTVTVNIGHVVTNERSHAPRCFVGHAKLALQFLGADTVARRGEKMDCVEPRLERGARLFERGANGRV